MNLFLLASLFVLGCYSKYEPNWKSLDSRPLPSWYDESKFGIFLHWGVFSVPSYGCTGGGASGEWFWWEWKGAKSKCAVEYMKENYPPNFRYQDFANDFKTTVFDPDAWAQLFKKAGAKYVVLTSKHHEGFCNWPSNESWSWNSVDVGPHQDNVKMVSDAVRKAGLRMGLYHSLFEWFNPEYLKDKASGGKRTIYVNDTLHPQLHDIVNSYKPDVIWSDGDWEMNPYYWDSTGFLAWLYNESPVKDTVVTDDRWGKGTSCKHGGFWTCSDRYHPDKLIDHKWENAMTIDKHSWGYRRNANIADYLSVYDIIEELVSSVSLGGNVLLNVGPRSDGGLDPAFEERLLGVGAWLDVNGDSIYGTRPWKYQNDTATGDIWYTKKGSTVYATFLKWPKKNEGLLTKVVTSNQTSIKMLGVSTPLKFSQQKTNLVVYFPALSIVEMPSTVAWTLIMTGVTPV